MSTNVGIIGIYPHEESWTSFLTLRKYIAGLLAEKSITPTKLSSIGIGLSRMVEMYANVSGIPFKSYTPAFRFSLSTNVAIAHRNYNFCSGLDHLFVIGESNHILDSIIEIADMKKVPVYSYLQLVKDKPSNSLNTENI